MLRALCRTRPSDWWDLGDDGNRLAIAICSVCPVRVRCSTGVHAGVIRGGVAWRDTGSPAPLCGCGRPAPRAERCSTCSVPDVALPKVRGRVDLNGHRAVVVEKLAAGWSYRAIGVLLGVAGETVRGFARRNGLRPQVDPQAA